jgi:FtsZ-binding cell division protein ZapB
MFAALKNDYSYALNSKIMFLIYILYFKMMTDPSHFELFSVPSSLNIEETILRSRRVMEESNALTVKHNEKKAALEEKLKSLGSLPTDPSPLRKIGSFTPQSLITVSETPKIGTSNRQLEEALAEVRNLHSKIASQVTNIRLLEMNLAETKQENHRLTEEIRQLKQKHRQEVQHITEMYENKLKYAGGGDQGLSLVEYKIQDLEDKWKKQAHFTSELMGKIEELDKVQLKQRQTIQKIEYQELLGDRNEEIFHEFSPTVVEIKHKRKKSQRKLEVDPSKKKKTTAKKTAEEKGKKKNMKKIV